MPGVLKAGDLLMRRRMGPDPVVPGFHVERVFQGFPDWVVRPNIIHWVDRTEIWALFRVTAPSGQP